MGGGGNRSGSLGYTKIISDMNSDSGSSQGGGNDCSDITFESQLQQPQIDALQKVEEGDVLSVRVHQSINRVEVLNKAGEVCGSVVSPSLSRLINCIKRGISFNAAVMSLKGEKCVVLIQHSK